MNEPTPQEDVKALRDALAALNDCQIGHYVARRRDLDDVLTPARIARLIAHIEAQAEALKAAVLAEREACAKICDSMPYRAAGAGKAAQAIRHRAAIASEAKT